MLLVEDDAALGEAILILLKKEGYLCEWAKDFYQADDKAGIYEYDCALIDITIPGGSGLRIAAEIKKSHPQTGIIILSAKNSLDDKIEGLDLGADDYLTKPFHLAELNSRIKALLRRRNFEGSHEILAGSIKIIPLQFLVTVNEKPVLLTRKEFDLLLFFVSNKNRVITKESIAEHLCGDQADASDSFDFVYTHVKNLRKKIMANEGSDCIKTIYGIGYKFQPA